MGRKRKRKKGVAKKAKVLNKKTIVQNTQKINDVEKVQIKKIKKQPTEKRIYSVKDYVVYAKHGVGKIVAIDKAKIGNIDINFYKVFIEKENSLKIFL